MHDRIDHRPGKRAAIAGTALSMLLASAVAAWSQGAPPSLGLQSPAQQPGPAQPASQQAAPPPAAPAQEENPGLLNEIGKLIDKTKSLLPPLKSPSETMEDLNARAKDAGDTLSVLKPSTMVTGRAACVVAANGAPDCKAGADRLCQSKGYKEGRSVDTDAAEKCSPKVFIPGRQRQPGDCKTENYVIKALCQ